MDPQYVISCMNIMKVSEYDWRMTFLPQFKACVKAGSWNLMCSYNRYFTMIEIMILLIMHLENNISL